MGIFHQSGRQAASLFCVGMGLYIVFALATGRAESLRWVPHSSVPSFNSACMMVLAGRLIWHDPRCPDRWTLMAAAVLVVLPLLITAQTVLGVNLALDWPEFHAGLNPDALHPGRVSPNSCLAFIASGLAVLVQRVPLTPFARSALTATLVYGALLVAASAVFGYLLELEALYRVLSFNKISAVASVVQLLLGGTLWYCLVSQDSPARYMLDENRITGTAVAVLSVLALLSGILTFGVLQAGHKDTLEAQYGETAKAHATAFAHSLGQNLEAADNVAKQLAIRQVVQRLNIDPRDAQALRDVRTVGDSLVPYGFSGIALETVDGNPVLEMGQMRLGHAEVRLSLQPAHTQLFWDHGLVLRSRTPIVHEGRRQGTLVTETRLTVLTDLLQDMQRAGRSTDVLLCGRRGQAAVCMPSRLYPTNVHIPLYEKGQPRLPVARALLGMSGSVNELDLRGVPVQAGYAPMGTFNLGLVIKTDITELYAPLRARLNVVLALLVVLVALGTWLLRARVHPLSQRIAADQRRLRTLTDNLPVLISYIDREHCLRFTNGTFREWLGIDPASTSGRHMREVFGPVLYGERQAQIDSALAGERVAFEMRMEALGVVRQLHTVYVPDVQPDGSVAGIYSLSNDVTALKEVEQQLRQLARVDTLTRLANRLQFDEKLPEAMARSRRTERAMALMFLDVDKFKSINDTLGHAAGDEVLKEFALRLSACVRRTDTVARLAGDEFVILLEGLKGRDEPDMIARKIIAAVGEPFVVFGQPLQVSTSMGVVFYEGQDVLPSTLLAQADEALYGAKAAGRNTYRWAMEPGSAGAPEA